MSRTIGTLLYTEDNASAGVTGDAVNFDADTPYAHAQISVSANASGTIKVEIQGRLNADAAWVTLDKIDNSTEASSTQSGGAAVSDIYPVQLMPFMRAKTSGGFGNNAAEIRVWLLAHSTQAVRADS